MFALTAQETAIRVIKTLNEGFSTCFSIGSALCMMIVAKEFVLYFADQVNNSLDRDYIKKWLVIMLGCDLVRMCFDFVTTYLE